MHNDIILSMQGITKVFAGVKALQDVNFELRSGEVHALIGENGAGKSTLMKVLLGMHQPDAGTIILDGQEVRFSTPAEALARGISMIHQEISLVPGMSVAENIWLGREKLFRSGGFINRRKRLAETEKLLHTLNLNIDPSAMVRDLSIASMQLVELARAVSTDAKIIIMDEPTSALTNKEIELLYDLVRTRAAAGTAIIFISHKLEEIFRICDRVTVLRDGGYLGTHDIGNIDMDTLISLIVGRENVSLYQKTTHPLGNVVLDVRNISQEGVFENVSFTVREGEVLGFAGLMGAGRTEIMQAIFGITRLTAGEVLYFGQSVHARNPGDSVRRDMGMVTEDRLRSGSIKTLSVMQNATLAGLRKISSKLGFYTPASERAFFLPTAQAIKVKYDSPHELIGQLSGGNQQKVIFARWLSCQPKLLILDEPTRGIDIGSKSEIYRLINELAAQGIAILLVSSEMPELLALSDRILVIREGHVVHEETGSSATQERLIAHAFGVVDN